MRLSIIHWADCLCGIVSFGEFEDLLSQFGVKKNWQLWYALGKLRAEKAAWRIAEQEDFKLVTICPGLITGPEFSHRNPTPTFAYLKGIISSSSFQPKFPFQFHPVGIQKHVWI